MGPSGPPAILQTRHPDSWGGRELTQPSTQSVLRSFQTLLPLWPICKHTGSRRWLETHLPSPSRDEKMENKRNGGTLTKARKPCLLSAPRLCFCCLPLCSTQPLACLQIEVICQSAVSIARHARAERSLTQPQDVGVMSPVRQLGKLRFQGTKKSSVKVCP